MGGRESFRPRVVSAVGRFGLSRFGLSRFGPGSFRPILVSRFGLILFNPYLLYNILYARCVCHMRLVYHAASLARVLGSITGRKMCIFIIPLKTIEKLQWSFLWQQYA